jgi:NAD(P)-dependent dehydrogenase (short-subunit alcohol dehydrogenase family)
MLKNLIDFVIFNDYLSNIIKLKLIIKLACIFQSFVQSFTEALRYEYAGSGITVQQLSPLFVNTKMNAFSYRLQESGIFVPDAATYAHHAVNTLGRLNHSTGYWAHGIQVNII